MDRYAAMARSWRAAGSASSPGPEPGLRGAPTWWWSVTAECSHRFALTGQDPEGRNRTIILWREADLINGIVVRRVVLTLDATMKTATILSPPEAIEVAEAILAAAR